MKKHWTEESIKDYLFSVGANFIAQLEEKIKTVRGLTKEKLADMLRLSKGRISQIFNSPGNLTLSNVIKFSRILGMKVSVVLYEDGDPQNKRGPINPEVFRTCWEICGKPRDFWDIENRNQTTAVLYPNNMRDGIFDGLDRLTLEQVAKTDNSEIKELSQITVN